MQFQTGSIVLTSYSELLSFCEDFSLYGEVEFTRPLNDNNGNVLIQSGVVLRPQHFARLQELEGRYPPEFEMAMTPRLKKKMREFVIREIAKPGRQTAAAFGAHLLENSQTSLVGLMENALNSAPLVLALYHLYSIDKDFFQHIASLAMLTLAIAVNQKNAPRYTRRHAFLAGLCVDLALGESGAWEFPIIGGNARLQMSRICARFAEHFRELPLDVIEAIAGHPIPIEDPSGETHNIPTYSADLAELLEGEYFRGIFAKEGDAAGGQEAAMAAGAEKQAARDPADEIAAKEDDPERAELILQILRIAHYVSDISRRFRDPEEFTEQAVYMIAYNSGKGLLDEGISKRIINAFQRYQVKANRVSQIAKIEQECLYLPSARAYPRPLDATQMLCKDRITSCPHYIPSWGIHVVSPIGAFGWLGMMLPPGEYPKCALGEQLKRGPGAPSAE